MSHEIESATGWCSLRPGDAWSSARFGLSSAALSMAVAGAPGPVVVALADVVGLDQLDGEADGSTTLEFAMSSGAVAVIRVPEGFVDAIVDALQRSRDDAPSPETHGPAGVDVGDLPSPPPAARSNSKSALAEEIRQLREYIDQFGVAERRAVRADVDSLLVHRSEVLAEVRAANRTLRQHEVGLVRVRREAVLQDVGVYRPRHPAENGMSLKDRLVDVQRRIDVLLEAHAGVTGTDDWTVNGSPTEGRKVVLELAHLLLRTYNAEADLLIATIRPYELDAAVERLAVTLATIHRLGASMRIRISDELHQLRVEELALAADQRELEQRERRAVQSDGGDRGVPGCLAITSNRGTLGERVVRIGVTGHDDVATVLDEVDGGRLPFRSDLHALVPAADAGAMLDDVRVALADRRVNLTDADCLFFAMTPSEVRDVLVSLGIDVARFVLGATAEEWHQSENSRHDLDNATDR